MDESESSARRESFAAQIGANTEMMSLLDDTPAGFRSLRRGEVVEGTVVQVGREELLVDIGTKAEAVIPAHEIGFHQGDLSSVAKVGDSILAMVIEPEGMEGHAVLSLARAQTERGWRTLQKVLDENTTIEAEVMDFNKGGLIVNVDGVRGFVPLSHIVDLRQTGEGEDSAEARLERMKGKTIPLKVIELNRKRNRLILSERAAEQERRVRDRDRLIEELQEGQVRTGRVTSIADFGAFVDLGGADGLVHLTELSWTPVGHPSQVVKVGDQVEVMVLGVDREKKKIGLSLKRLRAEPWEEVPRKYQIGQNVVARITKLATFGAFAELEPGIEGLIHISELSNERIQHPRSVVREGDVVTVKILRIETDRRRLGLSLRQAQAEQEANETSGMPMVYGGDPDPYEEGTWMGGARVIRSGSSALPSEETPDDSASQEPSAVEPTTEQRWDGGA